MELKDKINLILKDNGLMIDGWKKYYNGIQEKPASEDKASKIARVLKAGHAVALVDLYAGGASWDEPRDVDDDGSVSYDLLADNIDTFLQHYELL